MTAREREGESGCERDGEGSGQGQHEGGSDEWCKVWVEANEHLDANQGANVLLMDEPTNDLDVATLRSLEDALLEFEGQN